MNVEDIMTPRDEVVTVEIPGTRDDALEYLQDRAFSSVPVVKATSAGEVYRGIVSRGSLIENPGEDQLAMLADEIAPLAPGTSLSELADRMAADDEHRLPVVADDELVGIVTVTDVVRAIARGEGRETTVDEVASSAVNCVYRGAPLPVAGHGLAFARVPYAVVLDTEVMVGIITEVDILEVAQVVEGEDDTGESIANEDSEWAWEGIKAVGNRYMPTRDVEIPTAPVEEFMTDDLVTVGGSHTVQETAQLLIEHDIEQIPVQSGPDVVGVVQNVHLLEAVR